MPTRVSEGKDLDKAARNLKNQSNYDRDSASERFLRAVTDHFVEKGADVAVRRESRSHRRIRSADPRDYFRHQAALDHSAPQVRPGQESQSGEVFAREHLCARRLYMSVLRQEISFRRSDIRPRRPGRDRREEALG